MTTQLNLWNDDQPHDNRPLPLLVANKWSFAIQHYENESGYLYAVQDWIAGLTDTDVRKAQLSWAKLKIQMSISNQQLDYIAADGKTYQVDFTDDKGLYSIAQNLRSTAKRPQLKEIKDYLATAGAFADEMRLDPSKGIEAGVSHYERQGKSAEWIETRATGIFSRKAFTAALVASIVDLTKDTYAHATETLYKGLWQRTTRQLKGELNLNSKQNVRDAMSSIALAYTSIAEMASARKLGEAQEVPETVAMEIIYEIAKLISQQAKQTAALLGVDPFTGQPLLGDAS